MFSPFKYSSLIERLSPIQMRNEILTIDACLLIPFFHQMRQTEQTISMLFYFLLSPLFRGIITFI